MTDLEEPFKNRKAVFEKLIPFGFSEGETGYSYSASLVEGQFTMTVTVTKEGENSAEVIDGMSGERYVLHRIPGAQGAFVGAVRQEYESVLNAISAACFEPDIFKSAETKRVIQYVRAKYRDELEFLWPRTPNNAIFRRKDTAKWYAALLTVSKRKLGLIGEDPLEIIDLRMKTDDIERLVDGRQYFPGFHMNKKHWVTICLDGSVPVEEIFFRIDASFTLALK